VKYLGLITLKEILEKDKELIIQYKEFVILCFNSEDPSIKNRALEIIKVTVKNIILLIFINIIDKQRESRVDNNRDDKQLPNLLRPQLCKERDLNNIRHLHLKRL
jgi:hypothetical protein